MIVFGLGGNLGSEPELIARLRRARAMLAARAPGGDVRAAALYRTAPIGPAQPPFLNTAVMLDLPLDEAAVMAIVRDVEAQLGRVRDVRWGPRTLDVDVLIWDARVIHTAELVVPHPRLHERRFALQPLVDLVGEAFAIPGIGRAGDALARVHDQPVELIAARW